VITSNSVAAPSSDNGIWVGSLGTDTGPGTTVFAVDIMTCPRCRGAMRLVKIANKSDDIARVLADLRLGARQMPPAET
jgi:hypothetical protein